MKKYTAYEGSEYVAKIPDENGVVHYTEEENKTWQFLITRQMEVIKNRACDAYVQGLGALNFTLDRVPQCKEISEALMRATSWSVVPVPTLIPDNEFFNLLAHRKFPAATFIRTWEEKDYLKEPDIFHEYFGHCPLLTNTACADFMQQYGEFALKANEQERRYLARLYWFTIEFGLIQSPQGLRIYGGGILSSKGETIYSVESETPVRKPFDLMDVLRTPYRIDRMQPIYFVISDFSALYQLFDMDLLAQIRAAKELGDYPPAYVQV
jgi:phenylalanine-4-hydroxylase